MKANTLPQSAFIHASAARTASAEPPVAPRICEEDDDGTDNAELEAILATFLRRAMITAYVLFCLAFIIMVGIQFHRNFPGH